MAEQRNRSGAPAQLVDQRHVAFRGLQRPGEPEDSGSGAAGFFFLFFFPAQLRPEQGQRPPTLRNRRACTAKTESVQRITTKSRSRLTRSSRTDRRQTSPENRHKPAAPQLGPAKAARSRALVVDRLPRSVARDSGRFGGARIDALGHSHLSQPGDSGRECRCQAVVIAQQQLDQGASGPVRRRGMRDHQAITAAVAPRPARTFELGQKAAALPVLEPAKTCSNTVRH